MAKPARKGATKSHPGPQRTVTAPLAHGDVTFAIRVADESVNKSIPKGAHAMCEPLEDRVLFSPGVSGRCHPLHRARTPRTEGVHAAARQPDQREDDVSSGTFPTGAVLSGPEALCLCWLAAALLLPARALLASPPSWLVRTAPPRCSYSL
jgi:hypothetical protein